ncbi:hypothetical protein CCR75_008472 [Bremia lactucae]|uniref:Uncharacterized protein n=1 Tax=Bremia lactucae TaxID=4779 RepID=A0A976IIW1_BRELC|nr:hypothetical protein CCR75_008472 [Bremia lactucae]
MNKFDGKRLTTFTGGGASVNYSQSYCVRLSSNRLMTWIIGESSTSCELCFPSSHPSRTRRVVLPQTKAGLYHQSKELRAAVSSIMSKPGNLHPALDLIA